MSQTPPTTLGKYQIIREIARSNDIVYEAYDPLMNRRVALKELAMPGGATQQQKEDRVKRFLREARAAGSLSHPNIMTVYEVGEEAGRYFIAMEYLDGKTLRNELDAKGFLTHDRSIEVALAVLEGPEYAHSKGVIHRDIKPDNIQLCTNGAIKLTDFGIARLTFEPNLTMDGQVFGTPSYMSPEQVVGRDLDARSDLFSLAVVLYEMISGVKPFAGDSVVSITYAIMNKQPDRPQQVGWAIWQVLEKALDKSPQLRYRDAAEFRDSLNAATTASQNVVIDPSHMQTQQQPYGYGQQPYAPNYTPVPNYGGPVPPVQQQPPYIYSNPYGSVSGQQQYSAPIPYQSGMPAPVPVYYPPPPRKPLLSAKTRRLIMQVLLALLGIGALIGLVPVMVYGVTVVLERMEKGGNASKSGGTSAPQQQTSKQAEAQRLNAQGQQQRKEGDLVAAQKSFEQAISTDDQDAGGFRNLGEVHLILAAGEKDSLARAELYRRAAESFRIACDLEKQPEPLAKHRLLAAQAYYQWGMELATLGDRPKARDKLYEAMKFASDDPELRDDIRADLELLSQ